MNCPHCGLPVSWTAYLRNFIGTVSSLYAYGKLAGADPRYHSRNVWGCDPCKTAGPLPREEPSLEQVNRRMMEL